MIRLFAILALALGVSGLVAKQPPPPAPVPMPVVTIQITNLNAGETYTSPFTISRVYSPDPLPIGYVDIIITDSKGVDIYQAAAQVESCGIFSQPMKLGPAGTYTITAVVHNTTASSSVTINVK